MSDKEIAIREKEIAAKLTSMMVDLTKRMSYTRAESTVKEWYEKSLNTITSSEKEEKPE